MTVEAMSSLPLQAGGAVAAAAGRTALWAISLYMRQPLRNTALAALIGVSTLAGANALYKQAHHHPAPMFGSFSTAAPVVKKAAPVLPAKKPTKLAQPVSNETTGSVAETPRMFPTFGKDDVASLQQKLQTLGLFNGTVDGIFGPRTAKAIKAFEASTGRAQKGLLTTELVAMVRAAEIPAPAPIVPRAPIATPQAAPAEAPVAVAKTQLPALTSEPQVTATVTAEPLPAPSPLLPAAEDEAAPTQAQLPAVQAPAEDDAASAIQVATAEPEDVTPPVAPLAMAQPNAVPKRTVQTIAVRATTTQAPAPAQADEQQMPEQLASTNDNGDASGNSDIVASVQRGLNSLGFLHAKVSGVADEATAKAIRNFEVYFNYNVTGRVTKQLVDLLEQNGAVI
jgi:peptidoglycan hydrolase-like protein with peptidoglycan-binding domain